MNSALEATMRADSPALFETDSTLEALVAGLAECDRLFDAADAANDVQQLATQCEIHWALREKINRIPATTLCGLSAKARAAEFALKEDPRAENGGEGSFIDLSRSIHHDIAALAAGEGRAHERPGQGIRQPPGRL